MSLFNLGIRLKSAFGYVAMNESDRLRKQGFAKDNGIANTGIYVGDSTFEELTLIKNDSESLFFGNTMLVKNDDSQIFAPPPMISFSRSKKLIITEIGGPDAEVIERYGNKSWAIKIQGVMIDMKSHQYPKQQVIKLNEFFEVNAPFDVESQMFDDLNIKSIYFEDIDIAGVAGYADSIQYTLSARSIKPVEFFFTKSNN